MHPVSPGNNAKSVSLQFFNTVAKQTSSLHSLYWVLKNFSHTSQFSTQRNYLQGSYNSSGIFYGGSFSTEYKAAGTALDFVLN